MRRSPPSGRPWSSAQGLIATISPAAQAPTEKGRLGLPLDEIVAPFTGDLDGMVERRMVRVLTTYSKTQYFIDRGTPRGTVYDQGKLLEAAVAITLAPEELEDEDLLEMANAGLVDTLIVDSHKAWFWQRVWPKLKLYPSIALRTGGEIARRL